MGEAERFPFRGNGPGSYAVPGRHRYVAIPDPGLPDSRQPDPSKRGRGKKDHDQLGAGRPDHDQLGSDQQGYGQQDPPVVVPSLAGDGEDGEAAYVRPYTVTGGRTRPSGTDLPFEALVEALTGPRPGHCPESRRILTLASGQYLSVAELSAHLHLAIGVVRVLVGDLSDEGSVRVHGLTTTTALPAPATTLSVLESVLNGISAL